MTLQMARAPEDHIEKVWGIVHELQDMLDAGYTGVELGEWLQSGPGRQLVLYLPRILAGYETLIDNACDKSLDYLAWKPEIEEALHAREELQRQKKEFEDARTKLTAIIHEQRAHIGALRYKLVVRAWRYRQRSIRLKEALAQAKCCLRNTQRHVALLTDTSEIYYDE